MHGMKPIRWDHTDILNNNVEGRIRVGHHTLKHHALMMEMARSRSGARQRRLDEARHRRVTEGDISEMQSW